jgi:MFS family permease
MAEPSRDPTEQPYPPAPYAWYVVGVLTFVYIFSFIDRTILNLLVGPIRRDLAISDTQMSLLMGPAFAFFYTVFGIPLGRMADSRSRRGLVAIGFVAWSLFTAACGLAKNFWQMMLMRIGVGVGEATLSPAAYSLIYDYFPPNRRATAISVYGTGIYIGGGLALLLGGIVIKLASAQEVWMVPLVGPTRSWQIIFFAVGLPGVICSLLLFTVREPLRRGLKQIRNQAGELKNIQIPIREVIAYIKANKVTFLCHNFGISLVAVSSYGAKAWIPAFFVRTHGWTSGDIGIRFGIIVAICGTIGIVSGGRLADYMASRGRREANLRVMCLAPLVALPFTLAFPLVDNPNLSLALLVPMIFVLAMPYGCAPAAITQIMPAPMRGQAAALYLFMNVMVGLGCGPTLIAVMTDYVFQNDNLVRYSIVVVAGGAQILAGIILWYGLRPFVRSLDRLAEWNAAQAAH